MKRTSVSEVAAAVPNKKSKAEVVTAADVKAVLEAAFVEHVVVNFEQEVGAGELAFEDIALSLMRDAVKGEWQEFLASAADTAMSSYGMSKRDFKDIKTWKNGVVVSHKNRIIGFVVFNSITSLDAAGLVPYAKEYKKPLLRNLAMLGWFKSCPAELQLSAKGAMATAVRYVVSLLMSKIPALGGCLGTIMCCEEEEGGERQGYLDRSERLAQRVGMHKAHVQDTYQIAYGKHPYRAYLICNPGT
ncbi:hypothetical protein B484DRAFT_410540 [Ochromonadaceae sp. CCMP2298]|nr:hypothetical protein B484DRAFT_410540 [Ochromonadaceae sp. CCMP2298]